MYIVLTAVNVSVLISWVAVLRRFDVPYRRMIAMAPTPLLSFAGSYGSFDYNRMFAPVWVAIVMASAFDITIIGLAAYRTMSGDQLDRGKGIALLTVRILFAQNAIAAMFYIMPDVRTAYTVHPVIAFVVNAALSLLHASLVWVSYLVANYTLHDEHKAGNTLHIHIGDITKEEQNKPIKEPETQNLLTDTIETMDTRPTPQNEGNTVNVDTEKQQKWRPKTTNDERAAEWFAMHEEGTSYRKIAEIVGLSPSYVGEVVKTFREKQKDNCDE